jgi:hypothetical protein
VRKDLEEEQEGRFYKVCPELGTYKGWHDGVRKGGDTERPLRGDTFSPPRGAIRPFNANTEKSSIRRKVSVGADSREYRM